MASGGLVGDELLTAEPLLLRAEAIGADHEARETGVGHVAHPDGAHHEPVETSAHERVERLPARPDACTRAATELHQLPPVGSGDERLLLAEEADDVLGVPAVETLSDVERRPLGRAFDFREQQLLGVAFDSQNVRHFSRFSRRKVEGIAGDERLVAAEELGLDPEKKVRSAIETDVCRHE